MHAVPRSLDECGTGKYMAISFAGNWDPVPKVSRDEDVNACDHRPEQCPYQAMGHNFRGSSKHGYSAKQARSTLLGCIAPLRHDAASTNAPNFGLTKNLQSGLAKLSLLLHLTSVWRSRPASTAPNKSQYSRYMRHVPKELALGKLIQSPYSILTHLSAA